MLLMNINELSHLLAYQVICQICIWENPGVWEDYPGVMLHLTLVSIHNLKQYTCIQVFFTKRYKTLS